MPVKDLALCGKLPELLVPETGPWLGSEVKATSDVQGEACDVGNSDTRLDRDPDACGGLRELLCFHREMWVAERNIGEQGYEGRKPDTVSTGFHFDGAARVENATYARRSVEVAFNARCHRDRAREATGVEGQAQGA